MQRSLTPYGVEVRYPSDIPEPSQRETEEALSLAKKVRDAVASRLKETSSFRAAR